MRCGVAVFVNRPHSIGVKTGSDVVVLARFGIFAGGFGSAPLLVAARGSAGELARDIDKLLDTSTDFLKIVCTRARSCGVFYRFVLDPNRCRGSESPDRGASVVRASGALCVRFRFAWDLRVGSRLKITSRDQSLNRCAVVATAVRPTSCVLRNLSFQPTWRGISL
jgi:hypothetical protein